VKSAIVDFVARITTEGGTNYVPPADRIATFDNDGALWCEQPLQVQFLFLADRVKHLAATDRSLKERQPFKALPNVTTRPCMTSACRGCTICLRPRTLA
jgi:hypothetical protein